MRIEETTTFKKTVKVRVPNSERPDAKREHSIVCEFSTMPREELEEFTADGKKTVTELLERVLVGVEGVENKDGTPLAPADAAAACTKNVIVSVAIRDAFWEATQGARKS